MAIERFIVEVFRLWVSTFMGFKLYILFRAAADIVVPGTPGRRAAPRPAREEAASANRQGKRQAGCGSQNKRFPPGWTPRLTHAPITKNLVTMNSITRPIFKNPSEPVTTGGEG